MEIVCLTASDRKLLAARWTEHGNSHRRMTEALAEVGAADSSARLTALRALEKRFDLDLAEICHRFGRRAKAHPIERLVLDFIAEERHGDETQLWIMPDNVRQVRELMDGKLVGG